MADKHDVRKGVKITFADDVERTIKPLTIKALRKYVKIIEEMGEQSPEDMTKMSEKDLDLMVNAASIILEKVDPELSADRDRLEDSLDLGIFNDMMTVAMGASSPEE